MEYTTFDKKFVVNTHWYPVDGVRITINRWTDDREDWITVYDSRVIADNLWEAMMGALYEGCGYESEEADYVCSDWGIFPPDEDDE